MTDTIEKTDEEVMNDVQELLKDRVKLGVGYKQDEETGILTHQYLSVEVGNLRAESEPALLFTPFMPLSLPAESKAVN